MSYPSETPMNKGFPCSSSLFIFKPLRYVPHTIKELGDVARRVPKNTIIEKAMSYPAPRYYITLEVAIRNISLMYRGIQPDMYNPMKIDMYDSIFRKFVAKGLKYPGYSYLETIINNEAPSFYIEKRQFVRIINDKLKRK